MSFSRWSHAFLGLATAKAVIGLWVGVAALTTTGFLESRIPVFLTFVGVHLAVGAALLVGRGERAADLLGAVMLVMATPYAGAIVRTAGRFLELPEWLVLLHYLQFDAFTPVLLWLFVGHFPSSPSGAREQPLWRTATRVAAVVGALLFTANLVLFFGRSWPLLSEEGPLGVLRRRNEASVYWPVVFLLDAGALSFALWRARRAHFLERYRATLFLSGVFLGYAPLMGHTIGQWVFPRLMDVSTSRLKAILVLLVLDLTKITIPFTTSYAVLVQRVVGYRLVLRSAIRYALARSTLWMAVASPAVAMVLLLYANRHRTLASLAESRAILVTGGLLVAALLTLYNREAWMQRLDRRFFRESYDPQAVLDAVLRGLRETADDEAVGRVVEEGVASALHPKAVAVYRAEALAGDLVSRRDCHPPFLESGSDLVRVLRETAELLEFDDSMEAWGHPGMDRDALEWVAEGDFRLLAPILGSAGDLLGLVALGEKRNELPFDGTDRELLATIASSAALVLERSVPPGNGRPQPNAGETAPPESPGSSEAAMAYECRDCRRIGRVPEAGHCVRCGSAPLQPTGLPRVVCGKFRLDSRLGAGGMGIVFLAEDVGLGRKVALKTLPAISALSRVRLEREAKVIASVQHPNLSTIHGLEHHGRLPILVLEYLAGGSLRTRIRDCPFQPEQVASLGLFVCRALLHLHEKGILHRDIKPSNIAFAGDGTVKLLDFGLAKLLLSAYDDGSRVPCSLADLDWESTSIATVRRGRRLAGTPLYLPPEALRGRKADTSFDLWALNVVLFESLTGRHPFRGRTVEQSLARILHCAPAGLDEGDVPEPWVTYFSETLAKSAKTRPAVANEVMAQLERLA